jgi:hypothetical protein
MRQSNRSLYLSAFIASALMSLLAACGNPSTTTGSTSPNFTTTSNTPSANTSTVTPPTQAPTQAPTPAPSNGFRQLTGANFTINYPVGWQTSHKSQPGGTPGHPATEDIYGFVAPDNITGLHIVRNGDEQAVGGMINELLGGQFSCSPGDTSVPSQVIVGGVTWVQADLVCMIANNNYEVRELVNSSTTYGQTVIMYGAYQQVTNEAISPDFSHASDEYFAPMVTSFQFD